MPENWHAGNAAKDGQDYRGWIVGHFIRDANDVRGSSEVEIKWGQHLAGERRAGWQETEHRTTIVVLIEGAFEIELGDSKHNLNDPGDYVMWGPGLGHSWTARTNSTVLTVRWPSIQAT
jgi:quercetin dioxygenase-like cupin family protein